MADPVLDNLLAAQRDAASTFLVDVSFDVLDPDGDDLGLAVQWGHSATGPWTLATPQTYDRQHSATDPITSVPTGTPAKAVQFVWNAFHDLPAGSYTDVHVRVTIDDGGTIDDGVFGPFAVVTEVTTQADVLTKSLARTGIASRTELEFLGAGLLIPFRRGASDFVNGSDVELVKASVAQILGTRAAVGDMGGDLPWRPDFGCKLWVLRNRKNDPTLQAQAVAFVYEAFQWEPRAEVTAIQVEEQGDPNLLQILVRYRVISENVDANRVFLPEFEEVVTIAA